MYEKIGEKKKKGAYEETESAHFLAVCVFWSTHAW